jgi:hypothetical protein
MMSKILDMSFYEKSLWLLFFSLLTVSGIYFASVFPHASLSVQPHQVVLMVALIVFLVILQIVGNTVLALLNPRAASARTDERDHLIELKSARRGSFVLATGVFCSLCVALRWEGNFAFVNLLIAFWVLAQLVEIGSQLFHYRQGV